MEYLLKIWKGYERLLQFANFKSVRILNATNGGFLDVFEKVRYENIINNNQILKNNTNHKENYKAIAEQLNNSIVQNDKHKAQLLILQAINRCPDNHQLILIEAGLAYAHGDYKKVIHILIGLAKRWPQYIHEINNYGIRFYEAGNIDEALQLFDMAIRMDPYQRIILINYCKLLISYNRSDDVVDLCFNYLCNKPEDEEIKAILEESLNKKDVKKDLSEKKYKKVIENENDNQMLLIGNSHVSIFRRRVKLHGTEKPITVKWVGAITASHFKYNSSAAIAIRSAFKKTAGWKILSIGMHDIFKLCGAYAKNRYEREFINLISDYKKIFNELNANGKFGWLISPQELNCPSISCLSEKTVYEISQKFNQTLTDWCNQKEIVVINPLKYLLTHNKHPKNEFSQIDGIHLNENAIIYYIDEINRKTEQKLIYVPPDECFEHKLQAETEPQSLSLLIADELGLDWDRTKFPNGSRKELEEKLRSFISECLLKKGSGIPLNRDTNYTIQNTLKSYDFVKIYTYASEIMGDEINFDVDIRKLNTIEKLSAFIFDNKPLTKNDFFETLAPDSNDCIRYSETLMADSRIAAMDDEMYLHLKEILHLQNGSIDCSYGIIHFWLALVEAKRENYGLALNLLKCAQNEKLLFPLKSQRIGYYKRLWEKKIVGEKNQKIKKLKERTNLSLKLVQN
jgi:tetratricopeptide (TPR) repeat protein